MARKDYGSGAEDGCETSTNLLIPIELEPLTIELIEPGFLFDPNTYP